MSTPHPELVPYLEKYVLTWEEFSQTSKGRPKKDDVNAEAIKGRKSDLVTDLHSQGMPWAKMCELTGKTIGFIQKYTRATGNENSLKNRQENAARTGRAGAGIAKPWYSEQLKQSWENGEFDFHRGRVRPQHEIDKIKKAWEAPGLKERQSIRHKELWQEPGYRDAILEYHRSPEERANRSKAQTQRMKDDPVKWIRGKHSTVTSTKSEPSTFIVRSTYEARAVELLNADPGVISFEYEPSFRLPNGKRILPDFVVERADGMTIIEVKAAWALDHKEARFRLDLAEQEAARRGWGFQIWTEKELFHATQ